MKQNLAGIKTSTSTHGPFLKRLIMPKDKKGRLINMNYVWLKTGKETVPHSHDDCEEYFFFLEGKGEVTFNGKSTTVIKGDLIKVTSGETHVIKNAGKNTLYFLSFLVLRN